MVCGWKQAVAVPLFCYCLKQTELAGRPGNLGAFLLFLAFADFQPQESCFPYTLQAVRFAFPMKVVKVGETQLGSGDGGSNRVFSNSFWPEFPKHEIRQSTRRHSGLNRMIL